MSDALVRVATVRRDKLSTFRRAGVRFSASRIRDSHLSPIRREMNSKTDSDWRSVNLSILAYLLGNLCIS